MNKLFLYSVFLLLIYSSCDQAKNSKQITYEVKKLEYEQTAIPSFLKQLIGGHGKEFQILDGDNFINMCENYDLDKDKEENVIRYLELKALHELFTSSSSTNHAPGKIWNIPYYWHWVEPNPRHQIYRKRDRTLLKNIKPSKPFGNYQSFADIDRTPFLFLSDLFQEEDRYYHENGNSFPTFGWCSEKEMAFTAILQILGYNAKVKVEGGHSWTEVLIEYYQKEKITKPFILKIDNTFDRFSHTAIPTAKIKQWEEDLGKTKTEIWYNNQAFSKTEQDKIANFFVTKATAQKLERKVVSYLQQQ